MKDAMTPARLVLAGLVGTALVMGACSIPRSGVLKLYQRNSGDIVNVYVGESITVALDGDPSTEIHWIKVPGDPAILEQVGDTRYEPDMESHQAQSMLITHFKATGVGRTRLQLMYRHPGAAAQRGFRISPDNAFEVWVVVKEKK